jgi:integrase
VVLERLIARARLAGREHVVDGEDRLQRIRRLDQLLHTWKDRLGMKFRGGWHALRHGVGTALVEAGVREQDAQTVLRHATPQMTRHYYHARSENIRAAVDALDPSLPATPKRRKGAR